MSIFGVPIFSVSYNSLASTVDGPLGFGWTHSYNMRLIANDYGEHPNFDADLAPENANGITSSITYTNERDGERRSKLRAPTRRSASSK